MEKKSEKIEIRLESDIVLARKAGREMAEQMGFGPVDCIKIATAISELARNIFLYAKTGMIVVNHIEVKGQKKGVEILSEDSGPGIEDIEKAMCDGYSTSDGLGLGLPGTQRLMDEFEINSAPGKGTSIRTVKWMAIKW